MKLSELAKKTGLKSINKFTDKDFEGVYISDMVSDIITMAKAQLLVDHASDPQEPDRDRELGGSGGHRFRQREKACR